MPRQRIVPYLYYRDSTAALEFLCKAFGFEETLRVPRDDGSVMHAEAKLGDDLIMLGTPPEADRLCAVEKLSMRPSSLMCYVDDVDEHHRRASQAGARILSPPEDKEYGARMYGVADLEGHEWYFSQATGTRTK